MNGAKLQANNSIEASECIWTILVNFSPFFICCHKLASLYVYPRRSSSKTKGGKRIKIPFFPTIHSFLTGLHSCGSVFTDPGLYTDLFLILGSVKGLYFMKKVCILTKMESNGKFIITKYVESK